VGADALCAALRGIGVTVLRNQRVPIGSGADALDLVGVDDWSGYGPRRAYDLDGAVAGRDPERAAVLLAHQPRASSRRWRRAIGLQLSGHTHGARCSRSVG